MKYTSIGIGTELKYKLDMLKLLDKKTTFEELLLSMYVEYVKSKPEWYNI